MVPTETWRLFFAVPVSDEVRAGIVEIQRQLAPALRGMVKWVEPENLHVTLKFIGNVPAHVVDKIRQIGEAAAAIACPVELVAEGFGAFPSLRRPRVLWVGLGGDVEPLAVLAGELDRRLAEAGIAQPENRPFTAHITLGRMRRGARPPDLSEMASRLERVRLGLAPCSEFVLMRSHLKPTGPVYEVVQTFAAAGYSRPGGEGFGEEKEATSRSAEGQQGQGEGA